MTALRYALYALNLYHIDCSASRLAVALCAFIGISFALWFMASESQPHQALSDWTDESRPQSDILQAMGKEIVDGWPSCMESGFRPPNAWWEAETKTILQGQDFLSIQQVLRFRLYGEKDSLRHLLQHRSESWLDQILLGLRPTRVGASHHAGVKLNKDQKVVKILATVEPNRPSSPMGESWAPYKAAGQTEVKKIAADVAEDSGRQFNAVTFEDWVRSSIGYTEESVEGLLSQHAALSRRLHSYLRRHPSERDKYAKVKKVNQLPRRCRLS